MGFDIEEKIELRGISGVSLRARADIVKIAKALAERGYKPKHMIPIFGLRYSALYALMHAYKTDNNFRKASRISDINNEECIRDGGRTRIYLSGAITGRSYEEVKKDFDSAKKRLMHHICTSHAEYVSPLENGLTPEHAWEEHMKEDIKLLLTCDAIYIIGDISASRGAKMELDIARRLGIKILSYRMSDLKIKEEIKTIHKVDKSGLTNKTK